MAQTRLLPIGKQTFNGLAALVDIGRDGVRYLAEVQARAPLALEIPQLIDTLSEKIKCDEVLVRGAILNALVPLNGIRRTNAIETDDFLSSLDRTIEVKADDEWKGSNLRGWNGIREFVPAFFQPDNFFAQISKAFELIALRPAVFQFARIVNEVRPIFDEQATRILANLETYTLVVNYWDDEEERQLHIALDKDDLQMLIDEINRSRKKIDVTRRSSEATGVNLVTFGDLDDLE